MPTPTSVFISYSHVDRAAALSLSEALRHAGLDPFLDVETLHSGDRWLDALQARVADCGAFVVLVGAEGVQRWVGAEVGAALTRHLSLRSDEDRLPIHPVLLGQTAPEALPPFLALFQAERWNGEEPPPQALIDALKAHQMRLDERPRFEGCPYLGLAAFRQEHAQLFFGRRADTLAALAGLGDQQQRHPDHLRGIQLQGYRRWLQVEGASGSGKSSLVRAGMLPMVERGALWPRTGLAHWQLIGPLMPGRRPLERLAEALERAFQADAMRRDIGARHQQLKANARSLTLHLRGLKQPETGMLLVVDQFEELFTLADEAERLAFDAALAEALADADCPLFVVSTVRSDFLDRIEQLPRLATMYNSRCQRHLLGPIAREGLREVIELPAQLSGLDVSEVSAAMLRDAESEPGALPLVENALRVLWTQRSGSRLNGKRYEEQGGLAGMLSTAADALLERIAADLPKGHGRDKAALELLLALVKYDPGDRHTRRRITRAEAVQAAGNGDDAIGERVLAWLSGHRDADRPSDAVSEALRLVTVIQEADTAQVDLIHETLVRARRLPDGTSVSYWPMLVAYVEKHRDRDILRQQLAIEVEAWSGAHRLRGWWQLASYKRARAYRRLRLAKRSIERTFVDRSLRVRRSQAVVQIALLLTLGESVIWAASNNLPFAYTFVQPLWMLGWTPIPKTIGVPAPQSGTLLTGCQPGRDDAAEMDCNYMPEPREVPLPRVCDMGIHEVTFLEYDRYVWATGGKTLNTDLYPADGSWGRMKRPVINVSWEDAQRYVRWLNSREPKAGWRLPTAAEWEWAARQSNVGPFPWGSEPPAGRANYTGARLEKTTPVGSYPAINGLYDMAGNVSEWVEDSIEQRASSYRALRGGAWNNFDRHLRVAYTDVNSSAYRSHHAGFRVCRTP